MAYGYGGGFFILWLLLLLLFFPFFGWGYSEGKK